MSLNAQQYLSGLPPLALHAPPHVRSISPSSGPATGRTVVTLSGSFAQRNSSLLRCRFGGELVVPLVLNASLLECIAPDSARASAALEAAHESAILTFGAGASYLGLLRLSGEARVQNDAVQLTPAAAVNLSGYLAIPPSLLLPPTEAHVVLSSFELRCDLFIGSRIRSRF